jgi:hypothetical protein
LFDDEEVEMNKSQLIGGIICLALAGLFTVLYFALPASEFMFMVGNTNMPMVPAVILAIVGVVLLVTARGGEKEEEVSEPVSPQAAEKVALNKRLEAIGWGLFLVMLGGFSLVPNEVIAKGYWSIGVGIIMLGLNVTRYFYHIRMSGFTTFLGIISLVSGVAQLYGYTALEGAVLLIILGAYLLLKPVFDRMQLFGKVEQA